MIDPEINITWETGEYGLYVDYRRVDTFSASVVIDELVYGKSFLRPTDVTVVVFSIDGTWHLSDFWTRKSAERFVKILQIQKKYESIENITVIGPDYK